MIGPRSLGITNGYLSPNRSPMRTNPRLVPLPSSAGWAPDEPGNPRETNALFLIERL